MIEPMSNEELREKIRQVQEIFGLRLVDRLGGKPVPLHTGDAIWYADFDSKQIEPGIIFATIYEDEQLILSLVIFDNNGFYHFEGEALNKSVFKTKSEAISAIQG
ncbi:hypothetical protein [Merdimmobilis hominis]|uniref:hypothetical protein n=1 Tax=Merdimmobilis hominis TaxID=2897707 RepID=UPI0008F9395F|nr:hypothetical protein [Merdimmobilis hominis]